MALIEERGTSLLETLIVVAIAATVLIAMLMALSTGTLGTQTLDERITAQNLAIAQLEAIRDAPFSSPPTYPSLTPPTLDYEVKVETSAVYTNLQQITVSIYRNSRFILNLQDYKADR